MNNELTKVKRGFATLPAERLAEIAGMGGKAAHQKGRAHVFTSEEAREASRKSHESRKKRSLECLPKQ